MAYKFIAFTLTIFIVIGALYTQHNSAGYGVMLPNNASLWTLASLFIVYSMYRMVEKRTFYYSPFLVIVVLFCMAIFGLSIINSGSAVEHQILYLLAFTGLILFSVSIVQWQIKQTIFIKLLLLFCLIGVFHALVSIIQVYDGLKVWYSLLGYAPLGMGRGVPIGIIQQVNMNASLLATVAVASLYLISHKSVKKLPLQWRFLVVVVAFMSVYALALTGSRAGWLGFVLGAVLIVIARYKAMIKLRAEIIVWLLVVGLVFIVLNFQHSGSPMSEKVVGLVEGKDVRLALYGVTVSLIAESPLFGYGLLGYKEALQSFLQLNGVPSGFEHYSDVFKKFKHPHNELLFWVVQGGWLVFVGFIVVCLVFLKAATKQTGRHFFAVMGIAMQMLLQSQVSLPFAISILHLLLLVFLLLYAVKSHKKAVTFSLSKGAVLFIRLGLLLATVVIVFLSFVTLKSSAEVFEYNQRLYSIEGYEKSKNYLQYASRHPSFSIELEAYFNKAVHRDIRDNQHVELQNFLYWAENINIEKRSLRTLQNQILVYEKLGMDEQANRLLNSVRQIFPELIDE